MSGGMIGDFHTHILPGIDDGSADVEQSMEMLAMMRRQGICRVVATPHFYANHDTPERFLRRREAAMEALQAALDDHQSPEIYLGAEVHYFEGISDCEALEELTIADTPYILVEMPMSTWSPRMLRELWEMGQKRGLTPVIAHIDRYISPLGTHGIPRQLSRMPVLVQANARFFLSRLTRPMALGMLRKGMIHLLGSDCHNTTQRAPNLGQAAAVIRRSLGQGALDEILRQEARILGS